MEPFLQRRISRRAFIQRTAAATLAASAAPFAQSANTTLHNGITLGTPWPPRYTSPLQSLSPPYLSAPPAVIPVDVGRQLFVDDFLVEDTTLTRTFHRPVYHPASPVVRPDREWEVADAYALRTRTNPNPSAMTFSDGVFFDPSDRLFKMWYMGGYQMSTCLATSVDGIVWTKPSFDVVPGTNIVSRTLRDSSTVWLDQFETDTARRFKMSLYNSNSLELFVSGDGIHWREAGRTGTTGDRSTFFYNPFRQVWVFSIRGNLYEGTHNGRYRLYWESPTFADARDWHGRPPLPWIRADERDGFITTIAKEAEIYHLDCVAYESVLVGLFSVFRGEPADREKINEIGVGFSRDGFHWSRPDRAPFIPVSSRGGDWNWANVQSAGGGFLVAGDQLYFYVSGRQGRPKKAEPGVCSTGLAVLRRDGFASLDASATGVVTTRPIRFTGPHLFVNAEFDGGELRAEVLDRGGQVIEPYTRDACDPLRASGTRQRLTWRGRSLQTATKQDVRLRFTLTRGRLFSFWLSQTEQGHSHGYPAAGGPEFTGPIDRPGRLR